MSNIMNQTKSSHSLSELKTALADIGIETDYINNSADVAYAIREKCAPVGSVLQATVTAGPGIKVTPIERKGYRVSANSDATLVQDLTEDLQTGTAIQKVLYKIIHHMIPNAIETAAKAPAIVSVEVFRVGNDGIDYYDNKAFGHKGRGRKAGLRPYEWYLKIYTFTSAEPIYIGLGDMVQSIKREILSDAAHQTERQFAALMQQHIKEYHKNIFDRPMKPGHEHHKPGCDDVFGGFDPDKDFEVDHKKPGHGHHRPGHDDSFGGFDPDDGFTLENDCPICDEPSGTDLQNYIDNLKAH